MSPRPPPPLALDRVARRRWPSLLGWVLLAFGLSAVAGVLFEYLALDARLADETRLLARARRAVDARGGGGAPPRPLADGEIRPALAVAGLLARDWTGLLAELERAADDPGVALLELEQDAATGSLRLAGEARTLSEVFAFVSRLEAGPRVRQPRLAGYALRAGEGEPVVSFQLTARWEARP